MAVSLVWGEEGGEEREREGEGEREREMCPLTIFPYTQATANYFNTAHMYIYMYKSVHGPYIP